MTEAEIERRFAILEARVELLVRVIARLAGPAIECGVPPAPPPEATPPWKITSPGGAL